MGEVGPADTAASPPKPLRILLCGHEFAPAETHTREILQQCPHLSVRLSSTLPFLHSGSCVHVARIMLVLEELKVMEEGDLLCVFRVRCCFSQLCEIGGVELPRRVCMADRVLLRVGRARQNRAVRHLRAEDDASGCGGDCSYQC
jgi:hypothetical protein